MGRSKVPPDKQSWAQIAQRPRSTTPCLSSAISREPNDLAESGTLIGEALAEFIRFFLTVCIDQVTFRKGSFSRPGLRRLYAVPGGQHREYALTAMLATGSSEFSTILIPLLTNADQQIRLETYRSGMPFYPSSIGPDWQHVVAGWSEELRAEFVGELTMYQGIVEIGLIFGRSDPSLAVRPAALHGLGWLGQHDAVADIEAARLDMTESTFNQEYLALCASERTCGIPSRTAALRAVALRGAGWPA